MGIPFSSFRDDPGSSRDPEDVKEENRIFNALRDLVEELLHENPSPVKVKEIIDRDEVKKVMSKPRAVWV